jgi:hypothetical protein
MSEGVPDQTMIIRKFGWPWKLEKKHKNIQRGLFIRGWHYTKVSVSVNPEPPRIPQACTRGQMRLSSWYRDATRGVLHRGTEKQSEKRAAVQKRTGAVRVIHGVL